MRVHQLHSGIVPGDAICNHMFEIDVRLRAWGHESHIFAPFVAPEMAGRGRPASDLVPYLDAPDDLLIFHYGVYSPAVHYYRATRGRRILIYHNITPAHYFYGWDDQQAMLCDLGHHVLGTLIDCDLALGDSDFNRRELVVAGMPEEKTGVLPIFLSQERYEGLPVSQELLARLKAVDTVNILTVGRVVPNKGLDDAIRIFSAYHHGINPLSRLSIVGSRYLPSYDAALDELVADLQLEGAVVFTGLVSDAELKTYFQAADIYLTASRHEGFCVPLIEAMYFGVPIVARKAGAIPETLGEAGVLFTEPGYGQVAEMAHLLVTDGALRQSIVQGQVRRLDDLRPDVAEAALRAALVRVGVGG